MDEIIKGLYIGSYDDVENSNLAFTHVISIGCESPSCFNTKDKKNVQLLSLPTPKDTPEVNLIPYLIQTDLFIHHAYNNTNHNTNVNNTNDNGGKKKNDSSGNNNGNDKVIIGVHCIYGQSRSVTVIISYLICYHQMSLSSALSLMQDKHPSCCINPGFISQLHLIHSIINNTNSNNSNYNIHNNNNNHNDNSSSGSDSGSGSSSGSSSSSSGSSSSIVGACAVFVSFC